MADIVVVGSVNMDLVVRTPRHPEIGETILGESFQTIPGGKGANQAYGAAKQGGSVAMIGCVGSDGFGAALVDNLSSVGVDTEQIRRTSEAASGVAMITVGQAANNTIVVVAGANGLLTAEDVTRATSTIASAKILMVQLEIPLPAVQTAMRIAHEAGVKVILDPAPARTLPDEMLGLADIITPNQTESQFLTGITVVDRTSGRKAAEALVDRGVGCALVKLGADGVVIWDGENEAYIRGHSVQAVDTTAAGDAFAAGLAVALARGDELLLAVQYANAVGALSVTRVGAQSSMPTAEEVQGFLS